MSSKNYKRESSGFQYSGISGISGIKKPNKIRRVKHAMKHVMCMSFYFRVSLFVFSPYTSCRICWQYTVSIICRNALLACVL